MIEGSRRHGLAPLVQLVASSRPASPTALPIAEEAAASLCD
jgi:hypothetical protein